MNLRRRNSRGFTLIELMVVVAILGILVTVASSKWTQYNAKAKTAEAKIGLAAAYSFMQSYYSENNTYTGCLTKIGYSSGGTKRYYAIGFDTGIVNDLECGTITNDQSCRGYVWGTGGTANTQCLTTDGAVAATTGIATGHAYCPIPDQTMVGTSDVTQSSFTLGATGCISAKANSYDKWTITNFKVLGNPTIGY